MTDVEVLPAVRRRDFHFDLFIPLLIRPRKAMETISAQTRSIWLMPLLILSVLALAAVMVAGPLRRQALLNQPVEYPQGYEYWPQEMQQQFEQARTAAAGPMITHGFPALAALTGIWAGWLILGALLHLSLTLLGSRAGNVAAMNVVAWASLPFGVRYLVQIAAMLVIRQTITKPGLSGFVPADGGNLVLFLGFLLTAVDLYLIWQIVLITIGARIMSGLKIGKVLVGVLVAALVVLLLRAVPGFVGAKLGSLSIVRPFFF